MCRRIPVLVLGVVFALSAATARAQTPCSTEHDRPGGPPAVASYARPACAEHGIGYFVGGGCHRYGDPRGPGEGTWGWDYRGCLLPRAVVLNWCHGRCQGGTGAYRTVGTNRTGTSSP